MKQLFKKVFCHLTNLFPPCFGMKAVSLSIDAGYPGVYLWLGRCAIGFGGQALENNGYSEPNLPYGIYIKFGNFEWSNWNLDEESLP
jgi:hypothetical protein